jgi:hypothetical protein
MNYKEWRKRTAAVPTEQLLEKAYFILQKWDTLTEEQTKDILAQFVSTNKNDPCWEESLPSATMNFVNWGI